jgi:hypothetical protein
MNPPLATRVWRPAEVLHHVGNINLRTVNSSLGQGFIQQLSCWADKRATLPIFLIARLLAHEYEGCMGGTFPEHSLCRSFPEITCAAPGRSFAKLGERSVRGDKSLPGTLVAPRAFDLFLGYVSHQAAFARVRAAF